MTNKPRSWEYLAKMTAEAIKIASQKWYADCYLNESDMQRLMLWETRLREKLEAILVEEKC